MSIRTSQRKDNFDSKIWSAISKVEELRAQNAERLQQQLAVDAQKRFQEAVLKFQHIYFKKS